MSSPVAPFRRPAVAVPTVRSILAGGSCVAGLILCGLLVAAQPIAAGALVGLGLGVVAAVLRPAALAFAAIVLIVLVPVYAAPALGPLTSHPTVLAAWLAAGGSLLLVSLGRERIRLGTVDAAMAVYLAFLSLAVLFENREKADYLAIVFTTLGPYLAVRLVVPRLRTDWLPIAFGVATLVSLPFVLFEGATATSPFAGLEFNPVESAVWGEEQERFGILRAEGAFGQAISLSQFAGTAMLLALGAAVMTRRVASRRAWALVIVAGAAMLALSYSRTGWLIFVLGVVLIAFAMTTGVKRLRLLWTLGSVVVVGALLLVVSGLAPSVARLFNDDSLEGSNNFREILLQRALRGDGIAWFGLKQSPLGAGIETGTSIDNAYLALAADWGWVGMIGLILVGVAVAGSLWSTRGTLWALVPAVTLANFVGLFQVAINTQTKFWLWMLVGGCAGAAAAVAQRPDATTPQSA